MRLARPLEEFPFERTYIRAVADAAGAPSATAFDTAAAHAKGSPAWHHHEIATGHMVASNRPRELAEILVECACSAMG